MYDSVERDVRLTDVAGKTPSSDSQESASPAREATVDDSVSNWRYDDKKRIALLYAWAAQTHLPPSDDKQRERPDDSKTLARALDNLAAIGVTDGIHKVAIGLLRNVRQGKHVLYVVGDPLTEEDIQRLRQFYEDVMEAIRQLCVHHGGPSHGEHIRRLKDVIARQARTNNKRLIEKAFKPLKKFAFHVPLQSDLLRGFRIEVIKSGPSDPAADFGCPTPSFESWEPRVHDAIVAGHHEFQPDNRLCINFDGVDDYIREGLKCLVTASEQFRYPATVHPVITLLLQLHISQSDSLQAWNYLGSSKRLCAACWDFIKIYGLQTSWARIAKPKARGTDYRWENWGIPEMDLQMLGLDSYTFKRFMYAMHCRASRRFGRLVRLHISKTREMDAPLPSDPPPMNSFDTHLIFALSPPPEILKQMDAFEESLKHHSRQLQVQSNA